jgi:hypothetical protein
MRKLGSLYIGYGSIVGGLLLMLLLVGTQAARSGAEAGLGLLLGIAAPLPMLLLGVALRRGWKPAPILCAVAPIVLITIVARVWGQPQPPREAGLLASFLFNAAYSQLYFLPGTIVLGAIAGVAAMRSARQPV